MDKESNEEVEQLLDRIEVLVTDLQYNAKQMDKLCKDVDAFSTRAGETSNAITVLKREFRKRPVNAHSFEYFKVCVLL